MGTSNGTIDRFGTPTEQILVNYSIEAGHKAAVRVSAWLGLAGTRPPQSPLLMYYGQYVMVMAMGGWTPRLVNFRSRATTTTTTLSPGPADQTGTAFLSETDLCRAVDDSLDDDDSTQMLQETEKRHQGTPARPSKMYGWNRNSCMVHLCCNVCVFRSTGKSTVGAVFCIYNMYVRSRYGTISRSTSREDLDLDIIM